jgi:hypothetical protein
MDNIIIATIADLTQAKDNLVRVLKNTPEDKINWSPAATARTPIQIVAHSAFALGHISDMLNGTPYPAPTTADADATFLEAEKAYTNRGDVLDLLDVNYHKMVNTLHAIKPGDLEKEIDLPFGMPPIQLQYAIGAAAMHTRTHTSQLEYLQTIYGDRNW